MCIDSNTLCQDIQNPYGSTNSHVSILSKIQSVESFKLEVLITIDLFTSAAQPYLLLTLFISPIFLLEYLLSSNFIVRFEYFLMFIDGSTIQGISPCKSSINIESL